jgi:hypothetical protein
VEESLQDDNPEVDGIREPLLESLSGGLWVLLSVPGSASGGTVSRKKVSLS